MRTPGLSSARPERSLAPRPVPRRDRDHAIPQKPTTSELPWEPALWDRGGWGLQSPEPLTTAPGSPLPFLQEAGEFAVAVIIRDNIQDAPEGQPAP